MLLSHRRTGHGVGNVRDLQPSPRGLGCVARPTDSRDAGFSLIELLVVIIVLPMIMGVLALAIGTTYKAQTMIWAHLADAGDILSTDITFHHAFLSRRCCEPPTLPRRSVAREYRSSGLAMESDDGLVYPRTNQSPPTSRSPRTGLPHSFWTSPFRHLHDPEQHSGYGAELATSSPTVTLTPSTLQASAASGWILGAQNITNVAVAITQPQWSLHRRVVT